jgi:hypothetical protein
MSLRSSYRSPVDTLFNLAAPRSGVWLDYAEYGIGSDHVDDLVRMATDPDLLWAEMDTPESWAPVHAWRALGQLRASIAVDSLVELLPHVERDDWIGSELPRVFESIGASSIGALSDYVENESNGTFDRGVAAEALVRIARADGAYRGEIVETLSAVLARYDRNDPLLNSLVMGCLVDLGAVEKASIMESVFQSGRFDLRNLGDWEDVQMELGLLNERITPSPLRSSAAWGLTEQQPASPAVRERDSHQSAVAKARRKRKLARKSRKRNRDRR